MVFATGLTLTCVRPCPLLSWSVRVLSPPQQKGFVITYTPPHTTMVATRSTFASTGSGSGAQILYSRVAGSYGSGFR